MRSQENLAQPRPDIVPRLVPMLLALTLIATLAGPASAYPRPGDTTRASVAKDGTQANGNSQQPVLTPDGRYIAFGSIATNLVPGVDTRGRYQAYVLDRGTGDIEIVSISNDGQAANEHVTSVDISDDGRYVVWHTMATNLVPETNLDKWQIYLHDRVADTTELISRAQDGTPANRLSLEPSISGDGRYVAFRSHAANLVAGTTINRSHIYLLDRETKEVKLVSRAHDGGEASGPPGSISTNSGDSAEPVITPDGRYIAYRSHATNIVEEPGGPGLDVFVYDDETGQTEQVSITAKGEAQDKGAWQPSISADGRYVTFTSASFNMVPTAGWDSFHVYVHDRETGDTERVSVSSDGVEGDGGGQSPAISGDGRYIAYMSYAFNLVPEVAQNPRPDIYLWDRVTGSTELITVAVDGGPANSDSGGAYLNHDGSVVAYQSLSDNLVTGDVNRRRDVFIRERGAPESISSIATSSNDGSVVVEGRAAFSGTEISRAEARSLPTAPATGAADAEITGASVTYRVEQETLLFETDLAALTPEVTLYNNFGRFYNARVPAMVYGWSFDTPEGSWEVRVQRAALTSAPDALPIDHSAKLFRCAAVCVAAASLYGGVGMAHIDVRAGLPLELVGLDPGEPIENLRAFVAPGEITAGHLAPVGGLALPDATIPIPRVSLGIAPAGASESDIDYRIQADLSDSRFEGDVDISALAAGAYDVWAKACLLDSCGAASTPVTVGGVAKEATNIDLTVEGRDEMTLKARLTELEAPRTPIAGRTIDFYSDDALIGSGVTNVDGVAMVAIPPGHRGANRTYEAVFQGDELYAGSADKRPGRAGPTGGTPAEATQPTRSSPTAASF